MENVYINISNETNMSLDLSEVLGPDSDAITLVAITDTDSHHTLESLELVTSGLDVDSVHYSDRTMSSAGNTDIVVDNVSNYDTFDITLRNNVCTIHRVLGAAIGASASTLGTTVLSSPMYMVNTFTSGPNRTINLITDDNDDDRIPVGAEFIIPSQVTVTGQTGPTITLRTTGSFVIVQHKNNSATTLIGNSLTLPVQTSVKLSQTYLKHAGNGHFTGRIYTNDNLATIATVA